MVRGELRGVGTETIEGPSGEGDNEDVRSVLVRFYVSQPSTLNNIIGDTPATVNPPVKYNPPELIVTPNDVFNPNVVMVNPSTIMAPAFITVILVPLPPVPNIIPLPSENTVMPPVVKIRPLALTLSPPVDTHTPLVST